MYLSNCDLTSLTDDQIDAILFNTDAEQINRSDYAVLLGTEPQYALARARIAASFYFAGGTGKIIATGAAVSDPTVTECKILRRELLALGVPSDDIIDEPNAKTTVGNMICSLGVMNVVGDITKIKRVTVITEPFHICRSVALAKAFFPRYFEIYGFTSHTQEQRERWKTDERLGRCVKNEIHLLNGFIRGGVIEDIAF